MHDSKKIIQGEKKNKINIKNCAERKLSFTKLKSKKSYRWVTPPLEMHSKIAWFWFYPGHRLLESRWVAWKLAVVDWLSLVSSLYLYLLLLLASENWFSNKDDWFLLVVNTQNHRQCSSLQNDWSQHVDKHNENFKLTAVKRRKQCPLMRMWVYVYGCLCRWSCICECVCKKVAKTWIFIFKAWTRAMTNVSLCSDNAIEKLIKLS